MSKTKRPRSGCSLMDVDVAVLYPLTAMVTDEVPTQRDAAVVTLAAVEAMYPAPYPLDLAVMALHQLMSPVWVTVDISDEVDMMTLGGGLAVPVGVRMTNKQGRDTVPKDWLHCPSRWKPRPSYHCGP